MSKHSMTMRYPATRWQDACPTGSGIVGAMLYGHVAHDTLLLNHDGLYYPKQRAPKVDVSDQLPVLRELIETGEYQTAETLYASVYEERTRMPKGTTSSLRDPYQPFCALFLHTETGGPFRDYRRGVEFDTGRVWMRYSDGLAAYSREAFASRDDDAIWLRLRSDQPGAVSCRIALGPAVNEQANSSNYAAAGDLPLPDFNAEALPKGLLTFSGAYNDSYAFVAMAQVSNSGGSMVLGEGEWVVDGADEVVVQIYLGIGSTVETVKVELMRAFMNPPDYSAAIAAHVALHRPLFTCMSLDIGLDDSAMSNEEMLLTAYDGNVPTVLVQQLYEYGRYLLLCSSRAGGWPANLQGSWNGDYAPAWNSDFHSDENIQMNYWQALPGNLPDLMLPFFEYFERHLDDYRENAQLLYGCRGIMVPIAQTTSGVAYPSMWSNWIGAAAWLAQHFYDYYLFTEDEDFLRQRVVPWLREVALFYQDFLIEGEDGLLHINPSISPENRPTGDGFTLFTVDATMDVALCREVLNNLVHACDVLGMTPDDLSVWQDMLARLPAYAVNADGAMREWLDDRFPDNYHHRHQSHIYPLFPGLEITEETHPDLYEACKVAVEKRLVIGLESQSGWSMAHMANIYARLGMGNRALECIEILSRSSVGPNLLTYHNDWRHMGLSLSWADHPPFQIDANMGITAAVLEMLVFSKPGMIKLLPALPDAWPRGTVKGLRCRGNIIVDMTWERTAGLFAATLRGVRERILLKLPDWAGAVDAEPAAEYGDSYWWVDEDCVIYAQKEA